jgi:very-short-patch-repair endonuclease
MTKSELYAEANGLKHYREQGRYRDRLIIEIPCSKCGAIIKRSIYDPGKLYFCECCKKNITAKKKAVFEDAYEKIRTPKEQQFDKAVEELRNTVRGFAKYEKAIALCEARAEQFGSIPECMVAIELVRLGYKTIPQQKVGRYRVDFFLPEIRTVIEVDGAKYHTDKTKELERDFYIERKLNAAIIHIPAESIRKKIWKLSSILDKLQHRGKK